MPAVIGNRTQPPYPSAGYDWLQVLALADRMTARTWKAVQKERALAGGYQPHSGHV